MVQERRSDLDRDDDQVGVLTVRQCDAVDKKGTATWHRPQSPSGSASGTTIPT